MRAHRHAGDGVQVEWGLAGALALAADADLAVVVDVLSFTTTVTVAAEAGMVVWPYPWGDDATDYARARGATVAVGRSEARGGRGPMA
jgi:2-phosphosulfolactate phosphatase